MKLFKDEQTDRRFLRMQWRMLFATMIGYTLFYFMRKNFSFAMPGLQQDCGISKSMLGNFLFWGGIVYGISKFVNGIVGDKVAPRKVCGVCPRWPFFFYKMMRTCGNERGGNFRALRC